MADDRPGERAGGAAPRWRLLGALDAHSRAVTAVAAMFVPLIVGVVGLMVNNTISQRSVDAQYLELSIAILDEPVADPSELSAADRALRTYGADLLAHSTPVPLSEDLRGQLIDGDVGVGLGASSLAELFGQSAVRTPSTLAPRFGVARTRIVTSKIGAIRVPRVVARPDAEIRADERQVLADLRPTDTAAARGCMLVASQEVDVFGSYPRTAGPGSYEVTNLRAGDGFVLARTRTDGWVGVDDPGPGASEPVAADPTLVGCS